ncbi:MAG: hypothetical protein IT367_18300 [Candidatus Hydrogenedentes bacterium]|nr:hypothetical protein [Candidatus Hydrogenedentota bacterium]
MDTAKQLIWVGRAAAALCFLSGVLPALDFMMNPAWSWELVVALQAICALTAFLMAGLVLAMTPKANGSKVDRAVATILVADASANIVVSYPFIFNTFSEPMPAAFAAYYRLKIAVVVLCSVVAAIGLIRGWRIARWALLPILTAYLGIYVPYLNPDYYLAPPLNPPGKPAFIDQTAEVIIVPITPAEYLRDFCDIGIIAIIVFYLFALRGRKTLGDRFGLGAEPVT